MKKELDENIFQLEGRNPVMEAINYGKPLNKILVKKGEVEGSIKVIVSKARAAGIVVQETDKSKLDAMSRTGNHQGVIALCPPREYADVEDILEKARERGEQPFIIILDGITDTHNLGAVIRTANACGAHGVIIPKRRAASVNETVSKTSAGAIEHTLVARVTNIAETVNSLQKAGVWVACADMGAKTLYNADMKGPIALVIGAEGEGVSRLVREKCDFSVGIPMYGELASLNASVASAILMYEVVRQRNFC